MTFPIKITDDPVNTDLEFHEERYIHSVTCFANYRNKQEYFFETHTHWALFRWSTGA